CAGSRPRRTTGQRAPAPRVRPGRPRQRRRPRSVAAADADAALERLMAPHGRLRPDGYGVLRLGRRDYGFFLEFDRGTVRPAPLRAKFAAYHRYLASARAAKDFDGPPSILVVTAGPTAEDRVADAVLAAEVGQPRRLPLLLT